MAAGCQDIVVMGSGMKPVISPTDGRFLKPKKVVISSKKYDIHK
jgi:hypothetical protein